MEKILVNNNCVLTIASTCQSGLSRFVLVLWHKARQAQIAGQAYVRWTLRARKGYSLNTANLECGELVFVPVTDEYGNKGFVENTKKTPSFYTIQKLISSLPHNLSINFFDSYYPRISDPGAYVTISKYDSGYICTIGNHGWQDNPYYISIKEAAAYLLKNWNENKNNCILRPDSVSQKKPIKRARYYFKQLTLVNESKKYKMYEVNGQYVIKTRFLWYFRKIDLYLYDQSDKILGLDKDIKKFASKYIRVC